MNGGKVENNNTNRRNVFQAVLASMFMKQFKHEKDESLNNNPSPLAVGKSPERPRKLAVLIAVSYKGQKYELKGTFNDVKLMKDWLIHNFGFKTQNILILTEKEPDEALKPTRKNIEISMKWLVEDCRAGDSLVFYFSGHGLRQPEFEGDEIDGFDETICPVDFEKAGMILDNEIYEIMVRPLPMGVRLHAIVDACHSGTILDLAFVYNRDKKDWDDNSPPSGVKKTTSGGLAITISACRDDQMAADTDAFSISSADKKMSGALTHTLVNNVEKGQKITYGELLDKIYEGIEEADQQGCFFRRILRTLFNARLLQKPQLSSSAKFEVYQNVFTL